jgi:hypothetical protein
MDKQISISIPLDGDGFGRRGCPTCEREFKWLYTDDENDATEPGDRGYCCPYCGVWSQPDQWFTETQAEYIKQIGLNAAGAEIDEMFSQVNRPGSALEYTPGKRPPPPAELPPEPEDMRRVDFECHPQDPAKIDESWEKPVHCLICGTTA